MSQLLCGVVEEYIETGRPVGSKALSQALQLTISPATVRLAFQALDDEGYLFQPHTSSGRVPTDRGFRFYVDHADVPSLSPNEQERVTRHFQHYVKVYGLWTRSVAQVLADFAHTVAVAVTWQPTDIQEAGVHELLASMDLAEIDFVREVAVMIDRLAADAPAIQRLPAEPRAVFIGTENPILPAEHTSIVVQRAAEPSGGDALLVLAGAKRMAYQRNIALLDYVAKMA